MINKALHRQLTIEQDEPTSNLGMHLGDPKEVTIPAPPVTPVLLMTCDMETVLDTGKRT
jgi:hypothetical protein